MASIDDLFPLVLPSVPTATYGLARNAILRAVIELCEKGLAWQETLDPQPITNRVNEYELDLPVGTRISQIMFVSCAGNIIHPKTIAELSQSPGWMDAKGQPKFFTQLNTSTIRLIPTPVDTSKLKMVVRCALSPLRTATEFSDELYERYADSIATGALGYLLSQPGQLWTNLGDAAAYQQQFSIDIGNARMGAEKNFTRTSSTVRPRLYGR